MAFEYNSCSCPYIPVKERCPICRENKKPKDLKRAIGKLDKDDWNIKNIADMIAGQCGNDASGGGGGGDSSANATAASTAAAAPAPAPEKKVPKWSKAAFQVWKCTLEDNLT